MLKKNIMIILSMICLEAGLTYLLLSEQSRLDWMIFSASLAITVSLLTFSDPDNRKKLRWKKEYLLIEILFIAAVVFAVIAWFILNDKQVSISIAILILLLVILAGGIVVDKMKNQ